MDRASVVVIGAGIVGLAVAYRLLKRHPGRTVLVVEREDGVARHQTGCSSGVIHSGLFYTPGSNKAALCRAGRTMLVEFCEAHRVPHRISGKLIVATSEKELALLAPLHRRGVGNGVSCRMVKADGIGEIEPCARGVGGLHVRDAGVVDYRVVAARLVERISARGGRVVTDAAVRQVSIGPRGAAVITSAGEFFGEGVIGCAGLEADRIARMAGAKPDVTVVPIRGDFFRVRIEAESLVRSMIYPTQDPDRPFLGPHLTKKVDGSVEVGPNAWLPWSRAGRGLQASFAAARVTSPPLVALRARMAARGPGQTWRARGKRGLARAIARITPQLTPADLTEHRFGVRAHAVHRDGSMVDDFLILDHERSVHILSAPSPAATASFALADTVIDRVERVLDWA